MVTQFRYAQILRYVGETSREIASMRNLQPLYVEPDQEITVTEQEAEYLMIRYPGWFEYVR